jgi:cation:H+ antiporter
MNSMLFQSFAVAAGLAAMVWSARLFVGGASCIARYLRIPSLVIGMVIIGFGTSMPELLVSAISSMQNTPGVAIGNAFGSNIVNIGLILGLTALIKPITVASVVVKKELPILLGATALAGLLALDRLLSRLDSIILLLLFAALIGWTIYSARRSKGDALEREYEQELSEHTMPPVKAAFALLVGFVILIASSRVLVWGAVGLAKAWGISDLIIGLTIVALGTSLPELASSLVAISRNEHDLALGNVIGSNLFNILAVVGLAGVIRPIELDTAVLLRDWSVMFALTLLALFMGIGIRRQGRINRLEGLTLLSVYLAYIAYLAYSQFI